MKPAIIVVAALFSFHSLAQNVLPPPSPAAVVTAQPTLPFPSPAVPTSGFVSPAVNPVAQGTNTNFTTLNLADILTNLQAAVELTLPALANFNDAFDFVVVGTNGVAALVPDTGTNIVVNAGAKLLSIAPGTSVASGGMVAGTLVTNTTPAATLSRGQVAELLILQNDLQRLLPMLSTLNGVPPGITNSLRPQ